MIRLPGVTISVPDLGPSSWQDRLAKDIAEDLHNIGRLRRAPSANCQIGSPHAWETSGYSSVCVQLRCAPSAGNELRSSRDYTR